jgi:EAL domain-containing protein (putative c-di-GMP-specific phosphodiesterase class I)
VLQQACAQARAWRDAGLPLARMAVNVSARQFRDRDLLGSVRSALESAGLKPEMLDLELTESTVMQDTLHTRRTLEGLKAMGVQLSIDDFGTGYSSLGYLRSFPIDALKIDRSFVHDISAATDNGAIVAAILAMARSLKIGDRRVWKPKNRRVPATSRLQLAQGFYFCDSAGERVGDVDGLPDATGAVSSESYGSPVRTSWHRRFDSRFARLRYLIARLCYFSRTFLSSLRSSVCRLAKPTWRHTISPLRSSRNEVACLGD